MKLQYTASSGNNYDLNVDRLRTREANYHEWEWIFNGTELQYGMRVSDIAKKPAEYVTTLTFSGSHDQRNTLIENLHEDFELDIRHQTPGRITWGKYYIDCYIKSSSTAPDENLLWTDNKLTILCPYPFWIKETTRQFYPKSVPAGQVFLDYEYDYDYDFYYGNPGTAIWHRDFPFASKFALTIYGPVADPRVLINGYPYQINDTLGQVEYAVIDSRFNTIVKHDANGQPVNIFDLRDKQKSVFEPIPAGPLRVLWSGAFGFDITLFEERSEPRDE